MRDASRASSAGGPGHCRRAAPPATRATPPPRRPSPRTAPPHTPGQPPGARTEPTIVPDHFYICTVVTLKFNFPVSPDPS
ncbi:unnamed protein product, partial [Brenthis ino]